MTERHYIDNYSYTIRRKSKGYWLLSVYYCDNPVAFFQETYNDRQRAKDVAQFRIKMDRKQREGIL